MQIDEVNEHGLEVLKRSAVMPDDSNRWRLALRSVIVSIPDITIDSLPAITGSVSVVNIPHVIIDSLPSVVVSTLPAITGSVTVSNVPHVIIDSLPAISGTVAVSSLPAITGSVSVSNTPHVIVDSLPSVVVSNIPHVIVDTLPAITGSVTVSNIPHVIIDSLPSVNVGNTPHVIIDSLPAITGSVRNTFADSFYQDAFGRSRVSVPFPIFNSIHNVDKDSDRWAETLTTGGTSTLNTAHACVELAVTTTIGSKVVRQTKRSFFYITGMSKVHYQTFVFNPAKTGLRQRIGAFDDNNGIYLELTGSTVNFVIRSKVTGSVVENAVAQSSWNADKLNGSGTSGITLDLSKSQILFIDLQWLGVGRVRVGFLIDGIAIIAHQFEHANILDTVYISYAKLPLRVSIENIAGTASISTLQHICSSVLLEGSGEVVPGDERSANCGITSRSMSAGNATVVVAIRPIGNILISLLPTSADLLVISSNDVFYQIIYNPTITGGSWVSNSAYGEANVTATAYSGGTVVLSGYIKAGGSAPALTILPEQTTYLGHDLSLVADTYALIATPISGNGSCIGTINYKEIH